MIAQLLNTGFPHFLSFSVSFLSIDEFPLGKMKILQEDAEKMMRVAEREARRYVGTLVIIGPAFRLKLFRTRRRQAREHTLNCLSHQDGTSSDEEEAPSRLALFQSGRGGRMGESHA